jgi:hypothetical protein
MSLRCIVCAVCCTAASVTLECGGWTQSGVQPPHSKEAAPLSRVRQQGPASVWIAPSPGADGRLSMRLSGVVTIKLAVEGRQPLEVAPAERVTDSASWEIIKVLPPTLVALESGETRWEQTFQLMPLDKGDQPLPLTPLTYRAAKNDWQTVAWQPIPVTVTSVINRVDAGEASDITDIEHLPTPVSWLERLVWPAIGLLAGALSLAALLVIRRWSRDAAALPPDKAALRELDHLLALNLPRAGRGARFCFLVGNIVRRYLERRLELPVQRQTTAEFLAAARQASLLEPRAEELLLDVLERCDLAKFAGVAPTPQECDDLADSARRLVTQTATCPPGKAARLG